MTSGSRTIEWAWLGIFRHAKCATTSAWKPVGAEMQNLVLGGHLVINAIYEEGADKSVLTQIDYPRHLWLDKEAKSVAYVTGLDVQQFLDAAAKLKLKPLVQQYAFADAIKNSSTCIRISNRCEGTGHRVNRSRKAQYSLENTHS